MTTHALVGHEEVRRALAAAFRRGVLPSSLLLHGPRGVGKQELALWLARLTVCKNPREEGPCETCGPCRMARSHEHPDIHWYFPLERPKKVSRERLQDALEMARHQTLAEIRTDPLRPIWSSAVTGLYLGSIANLRARAAKRPTMADGPVFIVGQAELLVPQEASPEAANALLKLLEEPPGAARFILTSSEPGRLLDTIRSRTVPLHVPPLPSELVRGFLLDHGVADEKLANWAAQLGQGSIGRALAFIIPSGEDPKETRGALEVLRRQAYDLVVAAMSRDLASGYALAVSFPPAKARGLIDLFSFVEEWLRDLAAAAAGADERVVNQDALSTLHTHVRESGIAPWRVPDAFPCVERARELARGNVNPQLLVTGLVRDLRDALVGDGANVPVAVDRSP